MMTNAKVPFPSRVSFPQEALFQKAEYLSIHIQKWQKSNSVNVPAHNSPGSHLARNHPELSNSLNEGILSPARVDDRHSYSQTTPPGALQIPQSVSH